MAIQPTQQELREFFKYDAVNGKLLHPHCWVCGTPDVPATCKHPEGYETMYFKKRRYLMHRLIWIYHNGPIPDGCIIDHINHNRQDSRIENLRVVTRAENNRNMPLRKSNTSGHHNITVSKTSRGDRYVVRGGVGNKHYHIGRYDTLEEAIAVKKKFEKEHGFHENHGRVVN